MQTVAEMLEEAMRRKNISQQRLASETGITAPWINMILRRGRAPGPTALLRIAEALEIDKTKLVRQAHFERAYEEWKPYLEHGDEEPAGPLAGMIPLVGRSNAGARHGEGSAEVERFTPANGGGEAVMCSPSSLRDARVSDAPGVYSRPLRSKTGDGAQRWFVGFDPECMAIRVEGDALEPVAYDGQYVVVSPRVRKEDVPDGSIVYVSYELPDETGPRAAIRRMYRYRLAGEDEDRAGGRPGLPVYNFVPVNTRLRMKGHGPEPEGALTLRHRQVREMYPVVGVMFGGGG